MKPSSLFRLLAAPLLAAAMCFGTRSGSAQCCVALPANNTVSSTIIAYPPTGNNYLGAPSTFQVTLANPVGSLPVGPYAAWCIDAGTELNPALLPVWPGTLISTCDPIGLASLPNRGGTPPVGPTPGVVPQTIWNEVNYILNHRGTYFYWDVQTAINTLVGGPPSSLNPAYASIPQHPADVAAMLLAATNNPNYVPQCGEKTGVIYWLADATYPPSTTLHKVQMLILEAPTPTVGCVSISAIQGRPITPVTIVGSGGCGGPYRFSATGLPAGITMSSGGTISGTPSASGIVGYVITITDNCGNMGSTTCTITVNLPPSANCVTINAVMGTPITPVTMVGTGGCGGPYTFTATGLPGGLTMSTAGIVSGTPTASGTFNYTVTITDKCGNKGTLNCSTTVTCNGQIGDYVWSDLNSNGCQDSNEPGIANVKVELYAGCGISGSPINTTYTGINGRYLFSGLCPGTYTVNISTPSGYTRTLANAGCVNSSLPANQNQLDSKCSCAAGTACGLCVTLTAAAPINLNQDCGYVPVLAVACAASSGQVNVPYTSALVANGGCKPYVFSIISGALPPGLKLNTATGVINGIPTNAGIYSYVAKVTDNCGNTANTSIQNCGIQITPAPAVSHGDTATIGFWHNQNGQALINSFNGGPTSTKLGTWLASNYGCLFSDLNGKANSVVAAQFLTYFNVTGTKTYAQVMAGALADYATSSTLAGGSMAAGYGFNVSTAGTGAKTYNVGSNGTAIGLSNNTSYTVAQLLQAANAKCPWNATVFNALNIIFDGINTSGDIIN